MRKSIRKFLRRLRPAPVEAQKAMLVWAVLSLCSFALIWAGRHWGGRWGLLVAFFAALGLNLWVFFGAEFSLRRRFHAEPIIGLEPWGVRTLLKELTERLQVGMPELYLVAVPTPTLLSFASHPKRLQLMFSEALLQRFSTRELEYLFTYELVRNQHQETYASTLLSRPFALPGWLLPKPLHRVFWPLWSRAWRLLGLGPARADRVVIQTLGDPIHYAETLRKLASYQATRPIPVQLQDLPLFTVTPLTTHFRLPYFHLSSFWQRRVAKIHQHSI